MDNYKQISENHEPVCGSGFKESSKRKNQIAFSEPDILGPEDILETSSHACSLPTSPPRHNPKPFQVSKCLKWKPEEHLFLSLINHLVFLVVSLKKLSHTSLSFNDTSWGQVISILFFLSTFINFNLIVFSMLTSLSCFMEHASTKLVSPPVTRFAWK